MDKVTKVMHLCGLLDASASMRIHLRHLKEAGELGSFKNSFEGVYEILGLVKDLSSTDLRVLIDPVSDREKNINRIFEEARRRSTDIQQDVGGDKDADPSK
jgi:hypothetical protein